MPTQEDKKPDDTDIKTANRKEKIEKYGLDENATEKEIDAAALAVETYEKYLAFKERSSSVAVETIKEFETVMNKFNSEKEKGNIDNIVIISKRGTLTIDYPKGFTFDTNYYIDLYTGKRKLPNVEKQSWDQMQPDTAAKTSKTKLPAGGSSEGLKQPNQRPKMS